jgi:hypothetical protein
MSLIGASRRRHVERNANEISVVVDFILERPPFEILGVLFGERSDSREMTAMEMRPATQ